MLVPVVAFPYVPIYNFLNLGIRRALTFDLSVIANIYLGRITVLLLFLFAYCVPSIYTVPQ